MYRLMSQDLKKKPVMTRKLSRLIQTKKRKWRKYKRNKRRSELLDYKNFCKNLKKRLNINAVNMKSEFLWIKIVIASEFTPKKRNKILNIGRRTFFHSTSFYSFSILIGFQIWTGPVRPEPAKTLAWHFGDAFQKPISPFLWEIWVFALNRT